MKKTLGKIVIGTSMAIGMGALAANPAQAGTLTGATIGGTAANDYLVYDVSGGKTVLTSNSPANVQKVLDGNAASPTGNVELSASSEKAGFDFSKNTTLSGQIGGKSLTLSSLTLSDWTSTYKNTGKTFGEFWFNSALTANGFGSLVGTSTGAGFFDAFKTNSGFNRFSDPNISYVNQNDTTGQISIGLAGHLNATTLLLPYFDQYVNSLTDPRAKLQATILRDSFAKTNSQVSEIVKYTYNGVTDYLYSFTATSSGLVASDDDISHTGNYEVTIQGVLPAKTSESLAKTPEPSVILGLFGVAGIFAAQRQLKKVSM